MSGHNKWSQIKHKKGITDAKKGNIFSKLVREVMVAAKTGGSSSDSNVRLRSAIERARAEGVPKDNIERAIARASGGEEGMELSEILCEATGPGGVAIIIEAITDSKNRTINEIKHLLTEHNARLAEPGSLLWNFEKIGIVEVSAEGNPGKTAEQIESAVIESGAADFHDEEGAWMIETAFTDVEHVRRALEAGGITVKESGHDWKPRAWIDVSPNVRENLEILLSSLAGHNDVQEIYSNMKVQTYDRPGH